MLIGTFAAIMIIMGGGGSLFNLDLFKDVAKQEIQDKERRNELIAEVQKGNDAIEAYMKDMKDLGKKYVKANQHYHASRNDFDAISALSDTERLDTIRQVLDARYAMIGKMTREEWDAMYAGVDAKLAEQKKKAEEKARKK